MAELHLANIRTWKHDKVASELFNPAEIRELENALEKLASGSESSGNVLNRARQIVAVVFVFPQSMSERPTFSKLKRCVFCWGHWGLGMRLLLGALGTRERAMVFLDMPSGLRRGELAGLKWEDFDFKNLHVSVTRSLVDQHVGPVKTEASRKLMPIDEYVAHDLLACMK
jgi:hypothetical protein